MATRKNTASSNSKPNSLNPMRVVSFASTDLTVSKQTGRTGSELVPVTPAFRREIVNTLIQTTSALQPDWSQHPNVPAVLIFKLREKGIAKSHRPLEVAASADLPLAGHGRIDEMLVGASSRHIAQLEWAISNKDNQTFKVDLSAIERIQPWDRTRRCMYTEDAFRERGSAILRPFSYTSGETSAHSFEALLTLLRSLKAEFRRITQGRGVDLLALGNLTKWTDERFDQLLAFPGLRGLMPEPIVKTTATGNFVLSQQAPATPFKLIPPPPGLPTIGVFDSGTSSTALELQPWIASRALYVLPPDTDYVHGTAVASLAAAAGQLNDSHPWLPRPGCMIHDVAGVEIDKARISDIELRLRDALQNKPDVKVWNLSLGAGVSDESIFSDFAVMLDNLSEEFGVLFVISAGNYLDLPRRGWPDPTELDDRILSPSDAVRALTVGSIAHSDVEGQTVAIGSPSPYSRRGPGPVFTPKPDVVHIGGGVHTPWTTGASSIRFMGPQGQTGRSFGTSYAAPLASCLAAHAWRALDGSGANKPTPSKVKALVLHAAQLGSPDRSALERRYYGAGLPSDVTSALYDRDDSFTLMFDAQLVEGRRWRKAPYPIPNSLRHQGKFRGEIIITAVYSPPLDANAGAEYVRANLELSFGILDGKGNIKGQVPQEGDIGQSGYETAQIEHGGKWSPVKIHRRKFPQGCAGDVWALQATLRLRAGEPALQLPVNATILVTLRSVDGNDKVYEEGSRALNATNWVSNILPVRVPILL